MPQPQLETLEAVMDGLMRRYSQRVPDVEKILSAMEREQIVPSRAAIENDHIAFRTMGVPHLGIASFEKIFLQYGYVKRAPYFFESKKLDAFWFAPPEPHFPRIFVSELRVGDLSSEAQAIIDSYTNPITSDPVDSLDLDNAYEVDQFLHSGLWHLPTWADYSRLLEESEYAAWVIYNRYYLNHFTISLHNLPTAYSTVESFNTWLESIGIQLNNSGGKIKISPDGLLLQSSTVAEMVEATFACGSKHSIAGSYVEFAERRPLPEFAGLPTTALGREHRRDGFEAGNADKIFESTYLTQVQRG